MNLIGVLLFNLLLFNGCLTANVNRESTHPNSSKNSTNASALNEDFEYALFENTDLFGFLRFAKNPRVSNFVRQVIFPAKYGNSVFDIRPDPHGVEGNVDETSGEYIRIRGQNFYMDLLKYFGKSMQRIDIANIDPISDERLAALYKQVNEYCSESLNYLFLGWLNGVAFKELRKPFSNLIVFHIFMNTDQIGSFESLDKLFPKLERLSISYKGPTHQFNDSRIIESDVPHMEHLKELTIYIELTNHSDVAIVRKQVQKMLENNPQIRSLFLSSNERNELIQVISKNLLKLEALSIWNMDLEMEPVQIEHIKRFTLDMATTEPIDKLSFPRLEALSIAFSEKYANGSARDSWIVFFKNHQNIKQLNATIHGEGFAEFVSELQNVEEMYLISYFSWHIDVFRGLIEGNQNLVKIQYQSTHPLNAAEEAKMAVNREKFGNQWNITQNNQGWPTITFEKKN